MPIENEDQAEDELQQDDHDEEAGGEEDGQAAAPTQSPAEIEAARESRRERQTKRREGLARERDQAREESTMLRQQMADMARAQRESADAQRAVADAIKQGQPKPKSWEEAALERAQAAASSIKADDPNGATEFLRQQIALIREGAREAAREELETFKKAQPHAPTPEFMGYVAFAGPWLHQRYHVEGVDREAARIARKEQRDMSNAKVREATFRQAIAKYAADEGLTTNAPSSYRPDDSRAVAGAGSRSYSGGADVTPELNDFQRELADNHPVYSKIKDRAKRYAAAQKGFAKHVVAKSG
jgi:hypothetical protein